MVFRYNNYSAIPINTNTGRGKTSCCKKLKQLTYPNILFLESLGFKVQKPKLVKNSSGNSGVDLE